MTSPSSIALFRRARTAFNYFTLYLTFPSIKINDDIDYDSIDRNGVVYLHVDMPTLIEWSGDDHHWTIKARVLGFGVSVVRQYGY